MSFNHLLHPSLIKYYLIICIERQLKKNVICCYYYLRGRYWDIAVYVGVKFGYQPYARAYRLSVFRRYCLPSQLLASRTLAVIQAQFARLFYAGSHGPLIRGRVGARWFS